MFQYFYSPSQHGVQQNSQTPDVTSFIIALTLQHLQCRQRWSHIESQHPFRVFIFSYSQTVSGSLTSGATKLAV